jgi:hypothetical protein
MATAEKTIKKVQVVVEEPAITLTLSQKEANDLRSLLGRCSGPETGPNSSVLNIHDALYDVTERVKLKITSTSYGGIYLE